MQGKRTDVESGMSLADIVRDYRADPARRRSAAMKRFREMPTPAEAQYRTRRTN
jgi:hypothetical protein